MQCVVIESPYSGDVKRNVKYAFECIRDSCARGEAPFASHLIYTVAVDTEKYAQEALGQTDEKHWISREEGIKRCEAWRAKSDKTVFYTDLGWSQGMLLAKEQAIKMGQPIEERTLLK